MGSASVPCPARPRLFVYGSLMRGMEAHPRLRGARLLGEGTVRARLFDLGAYPGAVPGAGVVKGEVWELEEGALAALDAYEGFVARAPEESLFVRRRVVVRLVLGGSVRAWIYFAARVPDGTPEVEGGDWRAKVRALSAS